MREAAAALFAGACAGALMTLALGSGLPIEPRAQAAPPKVEKYEYQVATVDMLNHTVKVGEEVERFPSTKTFDQMLTETTQKGGWRLVNVYTIGAFGPFFVMERPAP